MPIIIAVCGILLLLLLILRKVSPFLALLSVSIAVGIASGMSLTAVVASLERGIGDTLGSIVLVIALGTMFGRLIEESGATRTISKALIGAFGIARVEWALVLTGFIVGIPMFYNAGFMILLPLVFSTARESGLPLMRVAIPMASSLSVTHGFLPPHPGPLALASIFHADIGLTLLYGIVIAVPTVIVAGPLFSRTLKNISAAPPAGLFDGPKTSAVELPPTSMSFVLALTPVVLITVAALLGIWFDRSSAVVLVFDFLGEPTIAFLLSVFLGVYFLHLRRGRQMQEVMTSLGNSVNTVASILLIIAAGGALKQIIIDAGVGSAISELGKGVHLSPIFVGWFVAALMRVALGSATVAGLTAAGIVLPIVQGSNVRPELMVLALGAGSLMFSHVNDTGFWMFKEFFNLSVKHTFRSWSIMETIVSVLGLAGVLILSVLWQ